MVFGTMLEQFVQSAHLRDDSALLENIFAPEKLDTLFERVAEQQYHRELLFSTLVDLMGFVVTRRANSIHAAYVDQRDRIPVSVKALYDKLSHVEGNTSRALVRNVASQVSELIDLTEGRRQPLLKGYRVPDSRR